MMWNTDVIDSPQWQSLRRRHSGSLYAACWSLWLQSLLHLSRQRSVDGRVPLRDLPRVVRMSESRVVRVLAILEAHDLVKVERAAVHLLGWGTVALPDDGVQP